MSFKLPTLLVALGLFFDCDLLSAQLIFEHNGNTNPVSENWTAEIGVGQIVGPISDDLGLGIDAWFVNDNSLSNGSFACYKQLVSLPQQELASTLGWELSVNLRIVTDNTGPFETHFVEYDDGIVRWFLLFDLDDQGKPIVTTADFQTYTLEESSNPELSRVFSSF